MKNESSMQSQLPQWPSVPHYYGDVVRIIFVICAVVVGLIAPLSGSVGVGLFIAMPIVLILIVLAGFTNPHSKTIMILDTVAAVLTLLIAETYAVVAYESQESIVFLTFEAISFLMLVAVYFSAKNVRASVMGRIGKIDGVGEFDDQ